MNDRLDALDRAAADTMRKYAAKMMDELLAPDPFMDQLRSSSPEWVPGPEPEPCRRCTCATCFCECHDAHSEDYL